MSRTLNNRYRLDKQIGEGGFAHVFLATDLELGRQIAVKVLERDWITDQELLARFRQEAKAAAALDHPNILQIYDFGVADGAPYIVMPYISGGTFADRMKQGPLTFDEIGVYLDQIGSALDYAHQRGVVHRDVKPANLLMRTNGQLVLMDFGLAKLLENASIAEKTGVMGTVAYLAPEQLLGLVSSASDIYMLGLILYQMLAGRLPFEGNTNEILAGHIRLVPRSLMGQATMREVSLLVGQALDQVIMKVLAKAPADRYPTCQALCSAYYKALKADPHRAARAYHREKRLDVRNLDATIVEPSNIPSTPQPRPQTRAPASPDATLIEPSNIPSTPQSQPRPQTRAPAFLDATLIEPSNVSPPAQPQPRTSAEDDAEATVVAPPPRRKKTPLRPPRLIVTTEPDQGFRATFDLVGETLTLGRAKDNNLWLPLSIVSRHHGVLHRINSDSEKPSYKIVQGQSTNPFFFKGKKLAEKVLENGDSIEIGRHGHSEYIVKLTYQAPEDGSV